MIKNQYSLTTTFRQAQQVYYIDNKYWLILGLDSMRKPTLCVYDIKNMNSIIKKYKLNISAGHFISFYDQDSSLLFTSMRGNNVLQSFNLTDQLLLTENESNTLYDHIKAGTSIPKRIVNTNVNEIQALYTLGLNNNQIMKHSIIIPRKSKGFDPSLYHYANDNQAALTNDQYFNQNMNQLPKTIPLTDTKEQQDHIKKVDVETKKSSLKKKRRRRRC